MKQTLDKQPQTIKVLLIEDDPIYAHLMQEMLSVAVDISPSASRQTFDLEWAGCLSAGMERLAKGDIDVMLLDLLLPDSRGFDTFVRAHAQAVRVPIIVLSGLNDQALAMKAVREGAQDYLVKGQVDGNLLVRAMCYAIERKRAEEELWQRNEELTALNAIATTISQSFDLDHILNATLDKVLEVMGIDAGWIQLLDESKDGSVLSLVTQRGFSSEMAAEARMVKVNESEMAQLGQPIVVAKISDDPPPQVETIRREAIHAFASVPIRSKDKVLGVLGVFSRGPRELSVQEVQLLAAIGHQVGVAVENARLAEEAAEIEILQELNRLRSELIANVSHELRTPLGLIKVFCTTLLREDADFDHETQREFLRDIDEETKGLERIVDNLLDLSWMESGRLNLDRRPTDVGQLTREVIEAIEMDVQPIRHHFVHDFPSSPLVVTVDAERIEQVLRNLMGNAVKYSPEGGAITIQGREDRGQVLVGVIDQGIGIPPQDLEKIFERFYRVENKVTQKVRGAGLGLPICRGIVEAHGGRIWGESTLGEGSAFYFTLKRET